MIYSQVPKEFISTAFRRRSAELIVVENLESNVVLVRSVVLSGSPPLWGMEICHLGGAHMNMYILCWYSLPCRLPTVFFFLLFQGFLGSRYPCYCSFLSNPYIVLVL